MKKYTPLHSHRIFLATFTALTLSTVLHADNIVIDGITFTDMGEIGEVNLGPHSGGLAVLDFDNDGFPDLFVGDRNNSNHLFHNIPLNGDPVKRTFEDVTAGSGLDDSDGSTRVPEGIVTADYDNDGFTDIYMIGTQGSNDTHGVLYHNNGDGTFTNVSIAAGVRFTGYSPESASWVDFDLDGDVDLMIASGNPTVHHFLLLENNGDGTFTNAEQRLPPASDFNHGQAYSHLWFDYDNDGYEDCFVIKTGTGIVLHNIDNGFGERIFVDAADDIGFKNINNGPMGISLGDYDNDNDLDFAITDFTTGTFLRNDGGTFTKVFPISAVWGWGNGWVDVDNDSDLDFYLVGSTGNGPIFNKLWENLGGASFMEISAALNGPESSSRYSLKADYDNDGRMDLFIINPFDVSIPMTVMRNESTAGNWFTIHLMGDSMNVNRDAIGATVTVTSGALTQVQHLVSGSSTTASEDFRLHFGLGSNDTVDSVEIVWPRSGTLESRTEFFVGPFSANQILTFTPGPTSLPGDLNGDGCVDQADLGILLAAYQHNADGDIDGDGDTDQSDLGILLGAFPNCI